MSERDGRKGRAIRVYLCSSCRGRRRHRPERGSSPSFLTRHPYARFRCGQDAGAPAEAAHDSCWAIYHGINLWIPSISFRSFLQSHPFTVISWAAKEQDTLDLLIEPQRGFTRELLYHAKNGYTINPIVMASGPHGANVSMDGYESVLMVASGFGIAAQLPHLKKLIYGYNTRVVRARRIHLVWQIKSKGRALLLGPHTG